MTCTDWSSTGAGLQYAGSTERENLIWLQERIEYHERGLEDLFFGECTKRFPVETRIAERLQESHHTFWVITSPEDFGWPTKRPHMFCVAISKRTCQWIGPKQTMLQQAFKQRFSRSVELTGDVLFCGPEDEAWKLYESMAKTQGNIVSSDVLKQLPRDEFLETILPPYQLEIYKEYQAVEFDKMSLGGTFVADLQQHEGMGSTAGPHLPCQLTHGTMMSFRSLADPAEHPRIMTGMEQLGAMGFHLFPSTTQDWPRSPRSSLFRALSNNEQKHISGNGMHLACLSSWLFFIFANIVRVSSVPCVGKMHRASSIQALDDEDEDLLEESSKATT